MADEIRQDLGFNAAQALETIQKLNAGFETMFQTLQAGPRTFDAFNTKAGKTNAALIQIKNNANAAATALGKVSSGPVTPAAGGGGGNKDAAQAAAILRANQTAAQKYAAQLAQLNQLVASGALTQQQANVAAQRYGNTMQRAGRQASGFALSLQTVVRVLGTQVIVRSLSAMVNAVERSFGSFIEFENKLATIRSISPADSIAELSNELTGLSNAFNLPLLDVAEAKYQALQNGFEKSSELVDVLNASFKFARITNTEAAASVDLVTSALNAYNLEASQAESLTAKFVRTIEVGRISGQELVAAFGRVAPVGKEIGATVDELLAAFSSITIGGVKANEAATQIGATMTALLKPSEAMKEAFKRIGVEAGDQAVQTFGLQGALLELIGTTNGSTSAIAKLFPNVRALRGVLREAGSGAEVFEEHLREVERAATAVLNRKFEIRLESDAEKVTQDFNKFTNFLTTEVGKALVQQTANVLKLTGGVDNLIGAAKAFLPTLAFATAALVTYGVATAAAAARTTLLGLAMQNTRGKAIALASGLTFFIGAALAAKNAGEQLGGVITRFINEDQRKFEEAGRQQLARDKEVDEAQAQLAIASDRRKIQQINKFIAEQRKAFNAQVEIARTANAKIRDDTHSTLDRIIEAHDRFANDLKRAAQDADDQVVESAKRSNDARTRLLDERFNRENEKLSEQSQLQNQQRRGEQIFAAAQKQLLSANTDEEIRAAQAAFDRSETFQNDALATAKTLGSKQQIFQIERRLEQIANARIKAEERFQRISAGEAARLRQEAAEQEKRVSDLKAAQKKFLDNSNFFDNSGNRLPEEEVTKRVALAKEALAEFRELSSEGGTFSVGELFSFDSLQRRLSQSVSQAEIADLQATPEALDDVVAQIQGQIGRNEFVINTLKVAGIDTSELEGLSDPEALGRATELLQEQGAKHDAIREKVLKRRQVEREIATAQKAVEASLTRQESLTEKISRNAQQAISTRSDAGIIDEQRSIGLIRSKIQEAGIDPNTDQGRVDKIKKVLANFADGASVAVNIAVGKAQQELAILELILKKRAEIKALEEQGATESALRASEAGLDAAATRIEALKVIEQSQKNSAAATTTAAQQSAAWKATTDNMVASSGTVASNFQAAAAAMQQILGGGAVAPTGTPTLSAATPTIATSAPRTATPNAPTVASTPGAVNFNVTNNIASTDPRQAAREVAAALNREVRRNASVLRTA